MLLELGRMISLLLSVLSLHALLASAFFDPGTRWEERLLHSLLRVLISACVCFASGLIFDWNGDWNGDWRGEWNANLHQHSASGTNDHELGSATSAPAVHHHGGGLLSTLPVRLFAWGLVGMALLFALSWYLETYYAPMLWRNQPH